MLKHLLKWSLLMLFPVFVNGQQLQFEPAMRPGELPQIPLALHQDKLGFIWIGTTDGLYRYDGQEAKEFRHDAGDSTTISNNFVKTICEDRHGNIWIGTQKGLNCFHPDTEKFSRHLVSEAEMGEGANYIHDIMEDHKGSIWYGTYDGLFQFDPATKKRLQFLPEVEQENSLSNKLVWSVLEDDQQRIWAGTHKGFTLFKNDGAYNFKPYVWDPNSSGGLTADRVYNIEQQENGTIWMATNDGLFRVIEKNGALQFQQFKQQAGHENSLSDNIVSFTLPQGNEKIWAGTYTGGLDEIILPVEGDSLIKINHYKADPLDESSISFDRIEDVLIDQSGMLWIGTGRRLDKVSNSNNKFSTLSAMIENPTSLSHNIIKSIFKDSFGNLWVGTFDGLNLARAENLKEGKFIFENFRHDPDDPNSISFNNIAGINEDSRNHLWICTHSGLNYLHIPTFLKNKKFNRIGRDNDIPHTFNSNIKEIKPGEYWLATNGGLARMKFDPEQLEALSFERFEMNLQKSDALVNSHTIDMVEDQFGDYWIGTFDGVSKYVERSDKVFFENYKNEYNNPESLSNNSFRCFYRDRKNRIWIGTRSGLNLVLQENKNEAARFRVYGMKDGFPNDVIHAIQEDHEGNLWVSTNRGLVVFNPDLEEQPVLKIYTEKDGLASSSFVFRAAHRDDTGRLYFGTANGLNYFDPDKIPTNTHVPPIRFTKLKVLNELVEPSTAKDAILSKSLPLTKEIVLRHWQNIITIEFAALDYHKPEQNEYMYQLSGLNENWVHLGHQHELTFTNLPAGTHTLQVKGSNNDGIWNEVPAQLIIKVLPPFWITWWAYLIYALSIAALLIGFIRFRIQQKVNKVRAAARLQQARAEERELLRKKNAADFHDELGHRLTKISLFLELAERASPPTNTISNYLKKIKTHAAGLSDGFRDLIWSLDPQKDSMYQTLTRLQEFGDQLFEFSDIHFKTSGIDPAMNEMELAPDVRKSILLIFKEAMNNALKYSEAKNAVLSTITLGDDITIIFEDDGLGFDPENSKAGYGLKNMQSRATRINGSMKIESSPGRGTKIQFIMNAKIISSSP